MNVESGALPGEPLTAEAIADQLGTRVVGRRVLVYPEVASTNAVASNLGEEGEPEGTVVVAETQTAGRGRMGKPWASAPYLGLWTSILLRPRTAPADATLLSQLTAVGLADAIAGLEPTLTPQIKWPNDLLLGERKVAGILVEVTAEGDRVIYTVVGIGVNCNQTLADFPPELQSSATSLALASGKPVSRLQVAQSLYRHLDDWYLRFAKGWREPIVTRLTALSGTVGRWVRVESGPNQYEAFAEAINQDGSLRVRLSDGEIRDLVSGDVSIR